MTGLRRLALAVVLAGVTGCGSTVQLTSSQAVGGSPADGLGATASAGAAAGPAQPVAGSARDTSATSGGGAPGGPRVTTGPAAPDRAPADVEAVGTIPGVTRTTITVGVLAADPQANTTLENAGFGAASLGDEPASWRAMAEAINEHGGIAGRRVELVFFLVNLTDPPAEQGQAACTTFTQDHKVALVLAGYYYASADTCLSQRGVPAFLGTNYSVDSTLARSSRTVVAWATPLLDRLAAALPVAFAGMGKLKSGTSAGIFLTDSAAFNRSAAVLSAALTRRGVKVVARTVRDSDSGDYSGAATDASAAVLAFRSAGVTEVLFLTHNAFEPTLLMQAASSQHYTPTYLLSTQQYPNALVGLVPAGQLHGALAVGWAPPIDLSSGYAGSPRARTCLAELKKHGRTYDTPAKTLVGLLACDGLDLLVRSAGRNGGLSSRAALSRNALDPANGFVSAVTIKTAFPGGRRDGVAAYRPMAFSDGCTCFAYTGALRTM